jgi:hypothetical protein
MIRAVVLMKKAVSTPEISVDIYQTVQRNIPEDSQLRIKYTFYAYYIPSNLHYLVRTIVAHSEPFILSDLY